MTPVFLVSQHEHHPFSCHTIRGGVEHGTYVMGEIARAVQNYSLTSTGLPTFLDIL